MATERAFADTNLFLRYLTNDVPAQAAAVEALLRKAQKGELALVTSSLVIAEIVWTMESFYKLPRADIRSKVLKILNTPGLEVADRSLVLQAIVTYADKNVDFIDAYNAAWMLARGIRTNYTFDRKHSKRLEGIVVQIPGQPPT